MEGSVWCESYVSLLFISLLLLNNGTLLRRTSTTNLDLSSHLGADNKGCPSSLEAFEVEQYSLVLGTISDWE
ncbi:hypothetical protein K1719_045601 [Acacia pycnantha]|nr:hypothetical protein K1719_045601 [Acacia pycnantha]